MERPNVGDHLTVSMCAQCNEIEGAHPQAGCCPNCGSMSGNMVLVNLQVQSYAQGDYWARDALSERRGN